MTGPNKRKWLWLCGVAAYLVGLGLLTLAERTDPNASIQTYGDALWYSLVTLSTVGYGDLYPVTALGRILGAAFIVLSVGLLAFLIGMLVKLVTGKMLPAVQLWLVRNRQWYIFSCQNGEAFALARDLNEREPGCVLLFPESADSVPPEQLNCLIYSGTLEALAARKKDRCSLCFMDERQTYEQAVAALETGHRVYCRTAFAPDVCPDALTLFDPCDCCARSYWQDHGLGREEKTVVLIGDGSYARELLTRGLLLNVFGPDRTVTYHVFGDWEEYLYDHHRLGATLCLEGWDPDRDRLYFHGSQWNQDPLLLAGADRIILCRDEREENIRLLGQIHRYFPVGGQIHLLCHNPIPGHTVFGTQESVYTAQLVLREQLSRAARTMHRIYRDSTGGKAPAWEELSEFLRQSNIAAADHLLTKVRLLLDDDSIGEVTAENCRLAYERYRVCGKEQKEICRWIEHQRWMRFHSVYNWQYAPVRNNPHREHPLMQPYEALTVSEQEKDDFAWELLESLAGNLDKQ